MNTPEVRPVGDYTDFVTITIQPVPGVPTAQETIRYDHFVGKLFKPDTEPMRALHAALGVCGEVGELIEANVTLSVSDVIEECGDLEFYLQAVRNHYGLVRSFVADYGQAILPSSRSMQNLVIQTGVLADVIKREYIYGKPRDLESLSQILAQIDFTLQYFRPVPRIEILQANANKLSVRYSSLRYSDAAAIARADKSAPSN